VAVAGNHAYVADGSAGLQVIDVSNPTNCVRVNGYDTSGYAYGVAVAGNSVLVADGIPGLVVIASLPNVQFTVRVEDAAAGTPCVIEASPVLGPAAAWTPLFTNPSPAGPFDFMDYDVKAAEHPQKFYRALQLAEEEPSLVVLDSVPNVQFTVRVKAAAAGAPCVIAGSPVLGSAAVWTPLFTNPLPSGPFDFVDFDVKVAEHPQKFYRAYQP